MKQLITFNKTTVTRTMINGTFKHIELCYKAAF